MATSANFAFLKHEFVHVAESATLAERHIHGDPRASSFHARHALERLVKRVYRLDKTLSPPRVQNLDSYLTEPAFLQLVPPAVWAKMEFVRKAGNVAVHGNKAPTPEQAMDVLRELSHVLYWAGRTYLRKGAEDLEGYVYDESQAPKQGLSTSPARLEELEKMKAQLEESEQSKKETEDELKKLQEQLAKIKAENEAVPETHDWNEAKTRKLLIDLDLKRAGWKLDGPRDIEYKVTGMPISEDNPNGNGYADYVLWGDDGKPLAVVEAKKTTEDPKKGKQQAKLYADCLEQMHGQRPVIFYTNGYKTFIWDDLSYPEREVAGFYKKDELSSLIVRRSQRQPLQDVQIKDEIVNRYYQKRAITSIGEHFTQSHPKALLVMATGTGKTRTAIALVDQLQRAGWAKRVLFLADRVSLVKQAANAFKTHLPQSSTVNLVTDKNTTGRIYVSTYPTMMGLIDETNGDEARFSVGHFDLIIIDEAHRSVYQKYGAIFKYFDSLLVGLTATPREQIDKNTYSLFGLESGMPTDAYELETAVRDSYLVPPSVQKVDLKFPRDGIDYDSLSEEEKDEWESIDWGDGGEPEAVTSNAINKWLFNTDTVDKVLQHLMEHGHKVEGGDRLAKTIIFARNHKHAEFIEERFNHHYPHYKGHFARIIDHYAKFPQSILDDFSQRDKDPHIAISVDMLDTGIDVPEVANLVFFKPVYSKIKFWQMIGRGTRLCPDLYGPGDDKESFKVFDFCFNFDYFNENPDGVDASSGVPLGTRLFRARVQLLGHMQTHPELDPDAVLLGSITDGLHSEVSTMNPKNFIVRMHLEAVSRFKDRKAWDGLKDSDREILQSEIAGLPSQVDPEKIEARLFDLTALRLQLALAEADTAVFEKSRNRVVEIAGLLEEKTTIPPVKAQIEFISRIQESGYWEGINLEMLEDLRIRLRELVQFIDKVSRKIVYTDFKDQILGVREEEVVHLLSMTGAQYKKKIQEYLETHLNNIVIYRLRNNEPLTATDLDELESMLTKIGNGDGQELLSGLLEQSGAQSLAHFVRGLVGMDRRAAQNAFSTFLNDRSLTPPQIRFIEMVIDQLTARGVMAPDALYEPPFSSLHAGGPDELFAGKDAVIGRIFETLDSLQPSTQISM